MSVAKVPEEKSVDLDDVLEKFSIFGRYHGVTMLLAMLALASNTMYCSNYIFAAEEVIYRCADASFSNFTSTCGAINDSGQYCSEWIYDNPHSFVAEYNLACQDWKRTLVGTAHSFGYMVGLLIVGPMSDRLGRKLSVVILGVSGGVLGLVRSFSPWYWLYVTLEFLEAAIGDICSPMYVLIIELVATKYRVLFSVICSLGYAAGGLTLSLIAWQVPYWRDLLRVIYTPALLFILYLFLLDESPRWLLSKGRKDSAVAIISKAADHNKIKLDKTSLDKIHYEESKSVNFVYLLKSTFSSKALAVRFVVCVTWWVASTFVNYGMAITSVSLPGNKYVNFAILSAVDIPGHILIMFILQKFKRKLPLIFSFSFGAILCVGQPFIPSDMPWLSTTVFMFGKLMSSFYFNITYIYTSELFPTYTRNSMHALCSSLGRVGSIVAPQTPLLMAYWSGFPSLVFGLVSLAGAMMTLLVPDTADDALPDTIRQAEELGLKAIKTEKPCEKSS